MPCVLLCTRDSLLLDGVLLMLVQPFRNQRKFIKLNLPITYVSLLIKHKKIYKNTDVFLLSNKI